MQVKGGAEICVRGPHIYVYTLRMHHIHICTYASYLYMHACIILIYACMYHTLICMHVCVRTCSVRTCIPTLWYKENTFYSKRTHSIVRTVQMYRNAYSIDTHRHTQVCGCMQAYVHVHAFTRLCTRLCMYAFM